MEEKEIQKLREKFPIPIQEISAYSSFEQILGKKPEDYTPEERYKRWEKNLSELEVIDKKLSDYWRFGSEESCGLCIYRDITGNHWCKSQELPCMYNPITKMLGMACYGLGKEATWQLNLFENN